MLKDVLAVPMTPPDLHPDRTGPDRSSLVPANVKIGDLFKGKKQILKLIRGRGFQLRTSGQALNV